MKRCVKCGGRLLQGAETCIICGKPVDPPEPISQIAPIPSPGPSAVISVEPPEAIPKAASVVSFKSSAAMPEPHIRLVTDPGEKPVAIPQATSISPPTPSAAMSGEPPEAVPTSASVVSFRSSAATPAPYIRFVTAPGGRRIEDSSTAKSYKTT